MERVAVSFNNACFLKRIRKPKFDHQCSVWTNMTNLQKVGNKTSHTANVSRSDTLKDHFYFTWLAHKITHLCFCYHLKLEDDLGLIHEKSGERSWGILLQDDNIYIFFHISKYWPCSFSWGKNSWMCSHQVKSWQRKKMGKKTQKCNKIQRCWNKNKAKVLN